MNQNKRHFQKHGFSKNKTDTTSLSLLIKNSAVGAACGILAAFLFLLCGAFLCLASSDPHSLITPIGLGGLYGSAFLGGIVTIRRHKSAPLPCGALCGVLILCFLLLLTLLPAVKEVSFSLGISLLLRTLIPVFSIMGAKIGLRQKAKHRRKR